MWDKEFKSGPIKIGGREPSKFLFDPFLNNLSHVNSPNICHTRKHSDL